MIKTVEYGFLNKMDAIFWYKSFEHISNENIWKG